MTVLGGLALFFLGVFLGGCGEDEAIATGFVGLCAVGLMALGAWLL